MRAGPTFDGASVADAHDQLVGLGSGAFRSGSMGTAFSVALAAPVAIAVATEASGVCAFEPMTAVMLANHRRVAPFGVAGGKPGAVGRNWVERSDGSREEFGATFQVEMQRDDVFVVQTPGGGGYGPPD